MLYKVPCTTTEELSIKEQPHGRAPGALCSSPPADARGAQGWPCSPANAYGAWGWLCHDRWKRTKGPLAINSGHDCLGRALIGEHACCPPGMRKSAQARKRAGYLQAYTARE
jgi:hypothetical protein